MRGYAGLCGVMRGYAGLLYAVLCGAMRGDGVPGDAFDRKKWGPRPNGHLALEKAFGLKKTIWPWKWGCENGFGRETGIVKTELVAKTGSIVYMVVKMILAVKLSLWKRQLLNSRVLCVHGSRQAHLAKRLVLQKVWLQTFCNSNSDIYIYILIQWLYEFLRVAFHHHHNIFHGNMDLDMGQIILYHRYRYASLALPWPTLLWGNPFRI